MRKNMLRCLLVLVLLSQATGCGDDSDRQAVANHQSVADVASKAEERLVREQRRAEEERQAAAARLDHESRKVGLATVLAGVLAAFGAVAVLLLARERRLRLTATVALKWLLDRRRNHG